MADPINLRQLTPQPVPEVVELAERVLEMAKSGDLIALAYAGCHVGRADGSAYALGDGSVASLVLGCERLKLRLLREGE